MTVQLELLHEPAQGERRKSPLLFIHGGFHGAWCWQDHFMGWFSEHGFECYAISLRDHGGSQRTGRHLEWHLRDYVEDAKWAADQLEEKPILVGHSLGGTIAQKMVNGGDFPAMILLAPSPIGGSNRAGMRMLFSAPKSMLLALRTKDMSQALPAFLPFFLSEGLPKTKRAHIVARLDGLTSFSSASEAFYADPPKPKLTDMPVLVVSGERDWSIPQYKNVKLAREYGGDHIVVPTAHDVMCDVGWDLAAGQILTWLNTQLESQS